MYYTDSFLNMDTYFGHGYMWHFLLTWKGHMCFFVCVSETKLKEDGQEAERICKKWFEQELTGVLERGEAHIQKELNRFYEWVVKSDVASEDDKCLIMHVYFQGKIYCSGSGEEVYTLFEGGRGWILKPKCMAKLLTIRDGEKKQARCVEEEANCLKADMLREFQKGNITKGYFVMWEETDDL